MDVGFQVCIYFAQCARLGCWLAVWGGVAGWSLVQEAATGGTVSLQLSPVIIVANASKQSCPGSACMYHRLSDGRAWCAQAVHCCMPAPVAACQR